MARRKKSKTLLLSVILILGMTQCKKNEVAPSVDNGVYSMYREFLTISDPAAYAAKSQEMIRFLQGECPWIFETHTMCFVMAHEWLSGYMPHDFAFNRWKYLRVDPAERERKIKSFKPFSMSELTY